MIRKLNIPAVLVTLLSVCWIASASAQATKVAIGYSGISADQLVIWVAKDTGIFAKNNLDAQPIYFTGGTLSVTAMVSGDTPLIQASGPGIVSAGLAGADPIYVVGGIVSLDYWLMTQPEIKTPEQLKGGTIAVARFGGAADFVARYALAPARTQSWKRRHDRANRQHAGTLGRHGSAARFGQHSSSAGDLCRAKKGLSSLGRCRRSRPRLSASRRGDDAKIFARASGRGAKFRQIVHRGGAPLENRPRHGTRKSRRNICA